MKYDWTESLIREMVNTSHVPIEFTYGRNLTIECQKCRTDWPCDVLLSMREWVKENSWRSDVEE